MKLYTALSIGIFLYSTSCKGMDAATQAIPTTQDQPAQWTRMGAYNEEHMTHAVENDVRGNWYIKRKFFIEARTVYEYIKQRIPEVAATKKSFTDLHDAVMHDVDLFFTQLGTEPQALDAALTATINALDQERIAKEQLTEKERGTLADLEVTKKELIQVQDDIRVLTENRAALDKVMQILTTQLDACSAYEQRAWDKYEAIADVLNDYKAEQMYCEMQSYKNHINAIDAYLKGQLLDYFNQLITVVHDQITSIKNALEKLKLQGIVFEAEAASELHKKQALVKKVTQQPEAHTWYERIIQFFKNIGLYLVYPFQWIWHMLASLWQ